MAKKDRLTDATGNPVNYSCGNSRYRTNLSKGLAHGNSPTLGSVFDAPLVDHSGYTLWLEHVVDIQSGEEVYWLMWYDPDGVPTIPMSGILNKEELAEMSKQLTSFVP